MPALLDEVMNSTHLPLQVVLARLLGTLAFCGVIGLERESRDRPAGLRTHMLVGLAACVYCILMLEVLAQFQDSEGAIRADPLRIIEAVTGGVAFLAAGMIVFSQGKVRGLTTGASLWLSAAIGVTVGLGIWSVALMTTLLAFVVIWLIGMGERRLRAASGEGEGSDERAPPGPGSR
jgi:putative Mg2+ transporter-C (MgtC) family protein